MPLCGVLQTWSWIVAALLLSQTQAHNHQRVVETYHASVGHLFALTCSPAGQWSNVSWSRDGRDLSGIPGVEVQGKLLWFKPVQTGHSGVYTCYYRVQSAEYQIQMELSVSNEKCPYPAERRALEQDVPGMIPCKHSLNSTKSVRWVKDCAPLHRPGNPVWVDERGQLWLRDATPEDAGIYTCFIDVSVGGQNYTMAWSVNVTLTSDTVYVEPHVVYPQDQTVEVELGKSAELRCLGDVGYFDDGQTIMYWILNGTHTDDYPEITVSLDYVYEKHRVQALSTLVISEVHRGFLDVPFVCRIENPAGEDEGQLWLKEADHSAFRSALVWSLSVSLGLLLLAACLYWFRVDLALAYREVRRRFIKHCVCDEKLYDAFVSCVHPSGLTAPELSGFCLQLLPQRLEEEYGYRLYIRGRDDCPGEAMHDAISETLQRSRRLLLLLSASEQEGALQLTEELQPLCYEQKVGLYDALVHKEARVILIEIGGPVDYSLLPESVRYLRRRQGALQWRPAASRGTLSFLRPESSFWKRLRYHMPPVPSGRGPPGA